ncbi:glutathione S-transferase N-terminal domain-containing protein [bacterium]|nr:glutathione S-transferase N-terminal domain-containing protein [bacterium]
MLNIFILPTCPYCKRVIEYLESTNLKYELLDINNQQNYDSMMKLGGKRQVPLLFDNEKNIVMYESNDIIEYLKTL